MAKLAQWQCNRQEGVNGVCFERMCQPIVIFNTDLGYMCDALPLLNDIDSVSRRDVIIMSGIFTADVTARTYQLNTFTAISSMSFKNKRSVSL